MSFAAVRKLTALLLTVCVATFVAGSPLLAADLDAATGRLSGKVVQSDGVTPHTGAVIVLVDTVSEQTFASEPTDDTGVFRIEGAPAGDYALIAETDGGAFLASDNMAIGAGDNQPVALTLNDKLPTQVLAPGQATTGGMATWAKWLIAGGIGVAALVLMDESNSEAAPSLF
ncbi:MAG: carboxypeptidase-like regulatory domain-containing protein [Acidobacteriota bacterium]|nr:carboxypeptidase-like regulatory domain-containing protein [Acidobacteriota bacterium]MDH3785212.1 carboxypeptidase-like regulatory domain-containing protein [Acidobacteriota bacterium]